MTFTPVALMDGAVAKAGAIGEDGAIGKDGAPGGTGDLAEDGKEMAVAGVQVAGRPNLVQVGGRRKAGQA